MGLKEAQEHLRQKGLDGWLVYDFKGTNPVLKRVLPGPEDRMLTRRVFYWIPAEGRPTLIGSAIDAGQLKGADASLRSYTHRASLVDALQDVLREARTVAMEYAPGGALPYVSRVDGGTLDLIRGMGKTVVPSGDLYQYAYARLSDAELATHRAAAKKIDEAKDACFAHIFSTVGAGGRITEREAQQFIAKRFRDEGLVTDHDPIVAVNAHAGDPHYAPPAEGSALIRIDDWILIDLWAKLAQPGSVYADVTWTGFAGKRVPKRHLEVFEAVRDARDAGVAHLEAAHKGGRPTTGAATDHAVREHLVQKGLAGWFTHRTGHSLGHEVHSEGANLDGFETYDTRELIPGLLFTIEPGVYLPEFGVRNEIDVFIHGDGRPEVTTRAQRDVVVP
ncbi:MAG TPA: M24 family metallopeptidase [Candidatus Thermoplasmatota archaeon]|nr:M24 family metallopeptidase [Candidatus Thermoplasmatota archaeon]